MEDLHSLEIVINLVFQSLAGWLETPMDLVSFLGTENFYFLVMPILYWCVDARLGLRVGLLLTFSNVLNTVFKLAFHSPRPFWVDTQVQALSSETSFGIPSGHAQNAASLWGWLGSVSKKGWVIILTTLVILLIGVSRLYLGMHFLSDVVAGWVVGGFLLLLFVRLDRPVSVWLDRLSFGQLLALCAGLSLVTMVVILGVNAALGDWQIPPEWTATALKAGAEAPNPRNVEGAFTLGGLFLGLTWGAAWLFRRAGGMQPREGLTRRVLSYLVGLVGVVVFWYGLGQVLPDEPNALSYSLRFLRYALVGGWVSLGAPWCFKRLRLVK